MNTKLRTEAKNDLEKDLIQSLERKCKMLENTRCLKNEKKKRMYLGSEPNYPTTNWFSVY